MTMEMLEAERAWLPQFEGKNIKPAPTIVIPDGTEAVHAPPRSGTGDTETVYETIRGVDPVL